jgi:hypothetical protein
MLIVRHVGMPSRALYHGRWSSHGLLLLLLLLPPLPLLLRL